MKRLLLICIWLAIYKSSVCQYWEPLAGGIPHEGGIVRSMVVDTFHDQLYIGGGFDSIGNISANDLVTWNGNQYNFIQYPKIGVVDMVMKKDSLLVVTNTLNYSRLHLYYDMEAVMEYPQLPGGTFTVFVYNDTVFVGGEFLTGIAYFNGTDWVTFEGGVGGPFAEVNAMTIYNGELIVAGHFDNAGGVDVNNIASWNGTEWNPLGGGLTGAIVDVKTLEVFNGELYAGGSFEYADGVFTGPFAKWNGIYWDTVLVSTLGTGCGGVYDLNVINGNLYVAGSINGDYGCMGWDAAIFDGEAWTNLFLSMAGDANAITVFNDDIIVGTNFDDGFNGDTINYLAHYLGELPTSVTGSENSESNFYIFPNPTSTTIHLQLPSTPTTITFFNLLGEKVREEKVRGGEVTMDASELPAGMYVVRAKETLMGKFVKE